MRYDQMFFDAIGKNSCGLVEAVVLSYEDPDEKGRVQVRYASGDDEHVVWARVASLYTTSEAGIQIVPALDSIVLVFFINGDPNNAVVFGSVWTPMIPMPMPIKRDGKTEISCIKMSKDGTLMEWGNKQGEETFKIVTPGGMTFLMNDKDKIFMIGDENKKNYVSIDFNKGLFEVVTEQDVVLKANQNTLAIGADGATEVGGNGDLTLKGLNVSLKANSEAKIEGVNIGIKASAQAALEGNALTVVKGGMVQIN